MTRLFFSDRATSLSESKPHPTNGNRYLTGVLTRPGIFPYSDSAGNRFYAIRLPEEVSDARYIASIVGSDFVVDHAPPSEGVVTYATYDDGDTPLIRIEAWVTGASAKAGIEGGIRELSAGYAADWVPASSAEVADARKRFPADDPGIASVSAQWFFQRNLLNDHVSLVERGRAGRTCSLDSEGETVNFLYEGTMTERAEGTPEKDQDPTMENPMEVAKQLAIAAGKLVQDSGAHSLPLTVEELLMDPAATYRKVVAHFVPDSAVDGLVGGPDSGESAAKALLAQKPRAKDVGGKSHESFTHDRADAAPRRSWSGSSGTSIADLMLRAQEIETNAAAKRSAKEAV